MKRFTLILAVAIQQPGNTPRHADDGLFWAAPMPWIPVCLGRATDRRRHRGAEPFGFPGVAGLLLVFEGVALAIGTPGILKLASTGWWITLGWLDWHWCNTTGLAGGPVGLAAGIGRRAAVGIGLANRRWKRARSQYRSRTYSYSGPECTGWNDARPIFVIVISIDFLQRALKMKFKF